MGLVGLTAIPASAAQNPTAACNLNGASTGTLQGWLYSNRARTWEGASFGECGTVYVRVEYSLTASGTHYNSTWLNNATDIYTSTYPYTYLGSHDATRTSVVVYSFL